MPAPRSLTRAGAQSPTIDFMRAPELGAIRHSVDRRRRLRRIAAYGLWFAIGMVAGLLLR